jgi:hypothetical protein
MNTNTLRATVVCGDTSYCGSGIYIYSVPSQSNPGNAVGRYYGGNTFVPECHVANNPEVNASPWGGKKTNEWLKIDGRTSTSVGLVGARRRRSPGRVPRLLSISR